LITFVVISIAFVVPSIALSLWGTMCCV